MKSFNKLIALLVFQGCFLTSFAQVSLDHTFTPTTSYYVVGFENVVEPIGYYCFITANSQISMYNADCTLYKTINVNLPSGFSLSSVSTAGKHIINTDDKAELFVSASSGQTNNSNSIALIINEDGQIISNLGTNYLFYSMGFHKVNDQIKMMVSEYHYTNQQTLSYSYSVYTCYGNFSPNSAKPFSYNMDLAKPYPNPAVNIINLPYQLEPGKTSVIRVYNMGGQMISSYNIGSDFDAISIDVSHYAKGVYTYEYDGISNKFVVQ